MPSPKSLILAACLAGGTATMAIAGAKDESAAEWLARNCSMSGTTASPTRG